MRENISFCHFFVRNSSFSVPIFGSLHNKIMFCMSSLLPPNRFKSDFWQEKEQISPENSPWNLLLELKVGGSLGYFDDDPECEIMHHKIYVVSPY